jgi:hypothetical protein
MLHIDLHSHAVMNDLAGLGSDRNRACGRVHRSVEGVHTVVGKQFAAVAEAAPVMVAYSCASSTSRGASTATETWQRPRPGMFPSEVGAGQTPAAVWASLILAQQMSV